MVQWQYCIITNSFITVIWVIFPKAHGYSQNMGRWAWEEWTPHVEEEFPGTQRAPECLQSFWDLLDKSWAGKSARMYRQQFTRECAENKLECHSIKAASAPSLIEVGQAFYTHQTTAAHNTPHIHFTRFHSAWHPKNQRICLSFSLACLRKRSPRCAKSRTLCVYLDWMCFTGAQGRDTTVGASVRRSPAAEQSEIFPTTICGLCKNIIKRSLFR